MDACAPFTYSQAPEEDYLPISSSDTRQLPLLNGIDTAAKSYASEPQRDGSPACTCTRETFGCSIHPNTRDEWIASQRASLARTLARPEIAQALTRVRAAVCGPRSSALLASFDRDSCSLKMSQQSWGWDSTPCSPILPSWGSMLDGAVYELPMLERLTSETDGGAWPSPRVSDITAGRILNEDGNRTNRAGTMTFGANLADTVMWRTRAASDSILAGNSVNANLRRIEIGKQISLAAQVKMWPTPQASDTKARRKSDSWKGDDLPSKVHAAGTAGSLNPTWVEWLMGWPLAWTVSKHWATVKSQRKPRSRGES